MPPVSFNDVPSGNRVPFTFVEIDSSNAQQGPSLQPFRGLVIGQRLSSGTVAELVKTPATSADQVGEFFGRGSIIHNMAQRLFEADQTIGWDFVALDDAGGGTDATFTITVTGTATEAGTIFLYVAGRRFEVGVANGDAQNDIASAIVTALGTDDTVPVTAAAPSNVVTLTARNAGTLGNDIDVRTNYFAGEETPAGVTLVIAAGVSGATDPSVSGVWAVLGDVQYNAVVFPFRDASNLSSVEGELEDRDGPTKQIGGIAYVGARDTHSNLVTLGNGRNSKYVSIIGANASPTPTWEWAASYAATVAKNAKIDPARPFQTLELPGVLPPLETDLFTFSEQNLLLQDGVATFAVDAGGNVLIQRAISTFQVNALGAPDTAFLDLNTWYTLDFLRYDLRTRIQLSFPRHKLANDGTLVAPGQAIVTPGTVRAFIVGIFSEWESLGLVEEADQFKRDLIVERNASDPNRLDVLAPPDLVNQLRQTAVQIAFLL